MKIAIIFDYKIELTIPDDLKDKVIEVTELLDTSKIEELLKK